MDKFDWNQTAIGNDSQSIDADGVAYNTLMSQWSYHLACGYLFFLSVFGVLMNVGVIVVIVNEPQPRTLLNWLLVNLAFSDGCIAGIGAPVSAFAAFIGGWPYSREFCVVYAMIMSTAGIASITTLTVLALWRCTLIVVHPANRRLTGVSDRMGHQQAALIVVLIWIYTLAITIPPLVGWGRYDLEAAHISCSVNWESQMDNNVSYIVYMFVFGLFVPVLVITVCYLCVLNVVRKTTVIRRQISQSSEQAASDSNASELTEKRVTMMIGIMIGTFLTAWTPYSVLALIETFGVNGMSIVTPSVATIPSLFAKSSSLFNPLVYGLLNTQFRAAWGKFVNRHQNEATTVRASQREPSHRPTVFMQQHLLRVGDKSVDQSAADALPVQQPGISNCPDLHRPPLVRMEAVVDVESSAPVNEPIAQEPDDPPKFLSNPESVPNDSENNKGAVKFVSIAHDVSLERSCSTDQSTVLHSAISVSRDKKFF